MQLSIITPAYNVEKYINRCLDSIYNQNFDEKEYEVIIINDGSIDKTESIINEYVNKHGNLRLINQKNQGASIARNTGLKLAKGDLIWYVDSDDAITDNSISNVIKYCKEYPNSDFLIFDRIYIDETKGIKRRTTSFGKKYIGFNLKKKNDLYFKPLSRDISYHRLNGKVPWLCIFRREYLINHNLFFLPGIVNEDIELFMRVFFFSKETRFIPFAHYIYTAARPGSVTTITNISNIRYTNSKLKTIENWNNFGKQFAKTKEDKLFIAEAKSKIYGRLLELKYAPIDSEPYLFLTNLTCPKIGSKLKIDFFKRIFSKTK